MSSPSFSASYCIENTVIIYIKELSKVSDWCISDLIIKAKADSSLRIIAGFFMPLQKSRQNTHANPVLLSI